MHNKCRKSDFSETYTYFYHSKSRLALYISAIQQYHRFDTIILIILKGFTLIYVQEKNIFTYRIVTFTNRSFDDILIPCISQEERTYYHESSKRTQW